MIDQDTQQLIDQLRDKMAGMDDQSRKDLISQITDGYCVKCGYRFMFCTGHFCEGDDND